MRAVISEDSTFMGALNAFEKIKLVILHTTSKKSAENMIENPLYAKIPKKLKVMAKASKNSKQYKISLYIVIVLRKLSTNFILINHSIP